MPVQKCVTIYYLINSTERANFDPSKKSAHSIASIQNKEKNMNYHLNTNCRNCDISKLKLHCHSFEYFQIPLFSNHIFFNRNKKNKVSFLLRLT